MASAHSRKVLVCAAAIVAVATAALAQEWQKIGEAPWRAFHLNADQPGVSYDDGSYKFYVSESQTLGPNRSLVVQAQSGDFEPDILVWNSAGEIVGRCLPDAPFTGDGGRLIHGCTVEVSQPPIGTYTIVTTTRDIDQGMVAVQWSLWELPGADAIAEAEPDDETTTDTRIRRCQTLAAVERAECLAAISEADLDPTACDFDPTGACRHYVAVFVMHKCQTLTDEVKRATCFMEVAAGWKDPDSCGYADEPQHCMVTIAAETQNPNLIAERFHDDPDYDAWMMMYGTLSGDLYAAELMRDNQKADYATMMIGTLLIARGEPLSIDLCSGLRGNYAEDNEDLNFEDMTGLCLTAVARTQELMERLSHLSDEEQIAAVTKLLESGNPLSPDAWNDLPLGSGGGSGSGGGAVATPTLQPELPSGIVDPQAHDVGDDCVPLLGQGC